MNANRQLLVGMPKAHVPCPICSATTFKQLAQTDRYQMGLSTVGCIGCGLVMTNPMPTVEALDRFYSHEYRRVYRKVDVPSTEHIVQYRLDVRAAYIVDYLVVQGVIDETTDVLDIGCAEGSVLKEIKRRFPGSRVTGVEPGRGFADFAKSYIGCEIFDDIDHLVAARHRRYDLIIANHILEHIAFPAEFLESLGSLLKHDGSLYLDVPNLETYSSIESIHLAHLYHFSRRTLALLFLKCGLADITMEAHTPPAHPKSIRSIARPTPQRQMPQAVAEDSYLVEWKKIQRSQARAWLYFLRRNTLLRCVFGGPLRFIRMVLVSRPAEV